MELPNFVNKFVFWFRETIGPYFPSSTSIGTVVTPDSPSTVGLSIESATTEEQLEVEKRNPEVEAAGNNLDWSMLFMAFCLTSAISIALYCQQTAGNGGSRPDHNAPLPLCFQLLSFFILLAFASLFVGRFIKSNYPAESQMLELAGILFGTTAFYLAMTMSFSLFLKACSWGVYGLSLLAIAICNRS